MAIFSANERDPQSLSRLERTEAPASIRMSDIISALSYALDLTEGQPMGHSVRACMIGMRIARQVGMSVDEQADLYYALLLKDAGCSSNASRLYHILNADEIRAKGDLKTKDWTRVGWESLHYALTHVATGMPFLERMQRLFLVAATQQQDSCTLVKIRCERGAYIAKQLGFSDSISAGIYNLDEHWNGRGYPDGLRKNEIPLFSRIANLSQTLDVFFNARGPEAAVQAAQKRSGRWFDPELVKAAASLANSGALWKGLDDEDLVGNVAALEPEHRQVTATEDSIDKICTAFAEVIDAKSPFTYRHSNGVADAAMEIGQWFGMNHKSLKLLRRAALLHDIGKLSVPNSVLEKPAKLSPDEWKVIKAHPYYTFEILNKIPGFEQLSQDAAAHHEKLDGSGYWRGWKSDQLSRFARILAVADIFDALHAKRPYRDGIPLEKVFQMLRSDAPHALDLPCVEALIASKTNSESIIFGQPEIAVGK
ncbi:MAG TPA: HD domain-containing phosphohydrolase [Candidatus Acidoferrales bacterium]|jgi:putative nucleotidyltransferase with HDIG domain|nr:HD domain-containing phosphohydrolase [Candidatus Acidoferrales bacterium]